MNGKSEKEVLELWNDLFEHHQANGEYYFLSSPVLFEMERVSRRINERDYRQENTVL